MTDPDPASDNGLAGFGSGNIAFAGLFSPAVEADTAASEEVKAPSSPAHPLQAPHSAQPESPEPQPQN